MRSLRTCSLLLLACLAIACKKDKDDTAPSGGGGSTSSGTARVEFTITGDGFTGQTITIDAVSGSGNALYSTADDQTTGSILANAQNQFQLLFDGNATGTFTCAGGVGQVSLGLRTNDQLYISDDNAVVITEYGAVGGWIRGTFSGTVLRSNGGGAGTAATISNGSFQFKRLADV